MDPKSILPTIDKILGRYPLSDAHRAAARRLALLKALALLLGITPYELLSALTIDNHISAKETHNST